MTVRVDRTRAQDSTAVVMRPAVPSRPQSATFSAEDLAELHGRYTLSQARTICEGFVASGVLERRGERVYELTTEGRRLCLDVALTAPVGDDGV